MENQYDINGTCRCCLVLGNHRHIMREYTYNGAREVYMEMFLDCMNLFLIHDARLPPLICSDCVRRLREVHSFRKLVSETEQDLVERLNNGTVEVYVPSTNTTIMEEDMEENIKTEESIEYIEVQPEIMQKVNANEFKTQCDEVTSDLDTYYTKVIKQKKVKRGKKKLKPDKDSSESDTPLSEVQGIKKLKKNNDKIYKDEESRRNQESYRDNNKRRSNIALILQNSTIIPFKNNYRTKYHCFYCNHNYISFQQLREHTETIHKNVNKKIIDDCLKNLSDLIVNADISYIKCKICNVEFKSIDNLINHLCEIHNIEIQETVRKPSLGFLGYNLSRNLLKCHICNEEFTYFKNLAVHMNDHYGSYVCNYCGKKFISERRINGHIRKHHSEKDTECKHCGEVFKSNSVMLYHVTKEHVKPAIRCEKCSETFPYGHVAARMVHMETVHGIKNPKFRCDLCNREYSHAGSLRAHNIYTHRDKEKITCDICGYITVHSTWMKRHMDSHNGVKNYECEFCSKTFVASSTLKVHIRGHLNDKRHVCTMCDAAFIQKNSLRNHVNKQHPDSGIVI